MTTRILPIAIVVLLVAGCNTTAFKKLDDVAEKLPLTKKKPKGETSEYASPTQLVAIWSDAVYTGPGSPPVRGFGGRLYFYDDNNQPLAVEGQLAIFAYDDSVERSPAKTPDRKFVFTPEQFTDHFTPSDLGASYSIWLPWDEIGGVRKSVTLLPVFTSTGGNVVMGQQSMNILPGRIPEDAEQTRKGYFTPLSPNGHPGVRPASYEGSNREVASTRDQWEQTHTFVPRETARKRLRSTTIQVPMTMTKRLVQEPSAERPQARNHGNGSEDRMNVGRRMPSVTDTNAVSDASHPLQQSADVSTMAPPLPSPPATRFVRPRYQLPRELRGRSNPVHPATSPDPEGSQQGHPSPRSWDHSRVNEGF